MRSLTLVVALLVFSGPSFPSHRHHRPPSGQAGAFDFYVFVLSWNPEFCHFHPGAAECSKGEGFVVHGLWPQNNDGTYPSNCRTSQPPPSGSSSVADIMPPELIQHEWREHGTCSGLSGDAYFALIRQVSDSIKIPEHFGSSHSSFASTPDKLKAEFSGANPVMKNSEMTIQLRSRYLNAVKICVSKTAKPEPIACSGLRDAPSGTFLVPPAK